MYRCASLALSFVFVVIVIRSASASTFGPFEDFRGHLDPSPLASLRTTSGSGPKGYDVKDNTKMVYDGPSGIDLRGAMYVTSQTSDYSGDLVFTTVYGLDPNPTSLGLSVFGFDPVPIYSTLSIFDERIVGDSGTEYLATVALTPTLADLPTILPGFDLSPFQGDPSSYFFLFQTTATGSDFAIVPEPSTLALAGLGLVSLGVVARRKKYRRA